MEITKELQKNIKIWVKALRSGKYQQDTSQLQTKMGFCCLGVACEIFSHDPIRTSDGRLTGGFPYTYRGAPLWLEKINDDFGNRVQGFILSVLNDEEKFTFNEIADCLEAVYIHKVMQPNPREV